MKQSYADTLALEVKQEIADRYFGFRKLIEEDKMALAEKIRQHSVILEKRISFDLIRVYILLGDEGLIDRFLALVSLPSQIFYDPYLTESKTIRDRVFSGVDFRGMTRKSCFTNAVIDCYERLVLHVDRYREGFAELEVERDGIVTEIADFSHRNDLGSILGFLRGLGGTEQENVLQGGMEPELARDLERKLAIATPEPVHHYLPVLSPLPRLAAIRGSLLEIVAAAYAGKERDIHDYLSTKTFFGRRRRR